LHLLKQLLLVFQWRHVLNGNAFIEIYNLADNFELGLSGEVVLVKLVSPLKLLEGGLVVADCPHDKAPNDPVV
jgi:hypothetical protein